MRNIFCINTLDRDQISKRLPLRNQFTLVGDVNSEQLDKQNRLEKCFLNIRISLFDYASTAVEQGWAISGPRATCGPSQRFQWPAEAFRKNHQIWSFLQLITENVNAEDNLNGVLLLFLLEQRFSTWAAKIFRLRKEFIATICLNCRFCLSTW